MTTPTLSTGPTPLALPRHITLLPAVYAPSPVAGQELTPERIIFESMRAHPQQGRAQCVWSPLLADCAAMRCRSMAREGWEGHVDPRGLGPNYYVRVFEYDLPSWYSTDDDANNIESLAWGGDGDPAVIWDAWCNSPGHREHVLGLNSFYAEQVCVGIGHYYLESSEHKHYWSLLSAPPEQP